MKYFNDKKNFELTEINLFYKEIKSRVKAARMT